MSISYLDHPNDAAIRRTTAQRLLEQVKERHKHLKGKFVTIPDIPHTQIFIREGRDQDKVIKRFVDRYNETHGELFRLVDN